MIKTIHPGSDKNNFQKNFITDFLFDSLYILEDGSKIYYSCHSPEALYKGRKDIPPLRLTFHILGHEIEWKKDDDNIAIYNEKDKMILNKSTKKITAGDKTWDVPLLLMKNVLYIER